MLNQAQRNLEDHFRKLSNERADLGFPVYAFEHGLSQTDIDTIRDALSDDLRRVGQPRSQYWLLWTVIGAEIGYTYDGDEYWHSFKSEIRGWDKFGDRDSIRNWFKRFASKFTGFIPSGRWADHFSIIAWPITHSILPQYLQSHFAKHLYDLRYEIAGASLTEIGALLENRYQGGSSRFENFLQQTALTARLVLALRDEDVQDAVGPIYRPTLARITADLEKTTLSRHYLRDTRRVLRDARVKVRIGPYGTKTGSEETASSLIKGVARGLKLICRPTSDGSWNVGVSFPDFATLVDEHRISRDALKHLRIRFADRDSGWMPAAALLSYSRRDQVLQSIPQPFDLPLIQFDKNSSAVAPLAADLKILSRPPWLLREYQDGICRQILGNHVRMGERYVIATVDEFAAETIADLKLQKLDARTRGINLYAIQAPKAASPQFLQALAKLALGYSLRVQVDPVGLVPRWDSSLGSSVWLPDEEILLHLYADFDISEFIVRIDGHSKTRFPVTRQNGIIVSLGTLPLGKHVIEIAAAARNTNHGLPNIAPEIFLAEVRPAAPWQLAIQQKAGIRALLEPASASLEDIVRKKASIKVHGPAKRSAKIEVRLFNTSGYVIERCEMGQIGLPSSEGAMARMLDKLGHEPLSERIQSVPRIDIAFVADELGASAISFSHAVPPLRWKLSDHKIRLIDEIGAGASQISTFRYDISVPDERIPLRPGQCILGVEVPPPGSLFIAVYQGRSYGAVASVTPRDRITHFSSLAVAPVLRNPGTSSRSILRLIPPLRLWITGRTLLGPLAAIRKATVVDVFEHQIERLACGAIWADQAKRVRAGHWREIDALQHQVGGSPGFASRIRATKWNWRANRGAARADFLRFCQTYNVSHDVELCDLALRLAFRPATIRYEDPKHGAAEFGRLCENASLIKGAYLARLAWDIRLRKVAEMRRR